VAGLHHQVLYQTLNSRLGISFLEDLYSSLLDDSSANGWVALQKGRLAGFISLTTNLEQTKKQVAQNMPLKDRFIAALHILTSFKDLQEFVSHEIFFRICLMQKKPFPVILTLGVDPAFQGKGVSTALINEAKNTFSKKGPLPFFVDTRQENQRAVAFYEKVGFKKFKVILGNVLMLFNFSDETQPDSKNQDSPATVR
jgi:ribosomal protein S18 acetylase RimI-like enzyme